jgi:hypothetical protein
MISDLCFAVDDDEDNDDDAWLGHSSFGQRIV